MRLSGTISGVDITQKNGRCRIRVRRTGKTYSFNGYDLHFHGDGNRVRVDGVDGTLAEHHDNDARVVTARNFGLILFIIVCILIALLEWSALFR